MANDTLEIAKRCDAIVIGEPNEYVSVKLNGHIVFTPEKLQAFREAIEAESDAERMKQPPVYAFRRKGQDDFCTCTKERFDELSEKPNLFEMRLLYAQPFPSTEQLQQRVKELKDTLQMARNGIQWYVDNSEEANDCDHEALEQIDKALANTQGENK